MSISIRRRKCSEYLKEEIPMSHYHVEIVPKQLKHQLTSVHVTHKNFLASPDTKFSKDDDQTTIEDHESASSFSSLYDFDFTSVE